MIANLTEIMHQLHTQRRAENGLWRDEVRNWEYDLYNVRSQVPSLQADFVSHERALAEQATAIRNYNDQLTRQEHLLAAGVASQPECDAELQCRQAEEAELHRSETAHFERVKRHHYNVMKHWRALVKALNEPM
jgi:multidrug resistance efflux pump